MNTKHHNRSFSLRLVTTSLLWGAMAFGSANMAFAQLPGTPLPGTPGFTMTFDENGNSTINGSPNPAIGVSPQGGVQYRIPATVDGIVNVFTPGDISPTNPQGFSDVISFHNGVLTYLSLLDDNSPPDLADVAGLLPAISPFSVMETGPEGNNGFVWTATDPTTGATAIYQGISDIPEPSTFILGGLGLIALYLIGRRRGALKKV